MNINPLDCLDLLCPPFNHPFHDRCHLEGYKTVKLLKIIQDDKENVPPDVFQDFEIKDLTLSLLFYSCSLEHEYEFYLQQIQQFNNSLSDFIFNKNTRNFNFSGNPLQENTENVWSQWSAWSIKACAFSWRVISFLRTSCPITWAVWAPPKLKKIYIFPTPQRPGLLHFPLTSAIWS